MNQKKHLRTCLAAMLLWLFALGCQTKDYNTLTENHKALQTYRQGIWGVRYIQNEENGTGEDLKDTTTKISINVMGELAEEDMLDIMDYYELTRNASFDKNSRYLGERSTDYTCYATFFQGETDEEICRIKYKNGQKEEPTQEEDGLFPFAGWRSSKEEIGEMP
ncbi:MAG: hypothetical protein HFH38_08905 [Lachnospiraceae bacterium]|jgi:hypothetical protein|nr:hypothetical protein [Lachnospiraceae bacterium]